MESETPTPEAPPEVTTAPETTEEAAPVEAPSAPESAPSPEPVSAEPPKPEALDAILGRDDVRAEIRKAAKLAASRAVEEEKERAHKEAERAKMEEVDRLRLEKQEAEQAAEAAREKVRGVERERDLAAALVASNVALADAAAMDFLRFKVLAEVDSDPDLAVSDAVARVLGSHAYLMKTPEAPPVASSESTENRPVAPQDRPNTAPVEKATQAPAAKESPPGVDVMKMSRQEYEEHRRRLHGIH